MNIFSQNESGTSFHRSRFTKSISNTMRYDCRFHELIPVLKRFVLPGDIWRIGGDVLVRFHPMMSPSLTPNTFRVRYFFVPLRLIETDTELIITGSNDGKLYAPTNDHPDTPVFDNFVGKASKSDYPNAYKVSKYTFWDYMGVQCLDYEAIKTDACLPALYWMKAYQRIFWDYYRDENLFTSYDDFDTMITNYVKRGADVRIRTSRLAKDYFTSSLPWQLKGIAPRIDVTGSGTWTPGYSGSLFTGLPNSTAQMNPLVMPNVSGLGYQLGISQTQTGETQSGLATELNSKVNAYLNQPQSVSITNLGFTADDLRTMMAQTRIFERLARCGSRYTEYLRANFGSAPADGMLQRAQYLGGWKVPIVTTEVLQTAEATAYDDPSSTTPIGTMRGHGITRGGNRISTFYAKEFGVLFGLAEIRPNVEYTTGIPRELTYKARFDFFNPSFQHLSEQEVRNGELFISNSDGKNDVTFGFQAYANELRTAHDETVGALRDDLSFWTQSLHFSSRPNLNDNLLDGEEHLASFNAPFVYSSTDARPCIVQFRNNLDVYRPMVRYATPGLVDHL